QLEATHSKAETSFQRRKSAIANPPQHSELKRMAREVTCSRTWACDSILSTSDMLGLTFQEKQRSRQSPESERGARSAKHFAEGAVFVVCGSDAVGRLNQGGDIAVSIVASEARI